MLIVYSMCPHRLGKDSFFLWVLKNVKMRGNLFIYGELWLFLKTSAVRYVCLGVCPYSGIAGLYVGKIMSGR